ncbi:MAG: PQQ-dependent sugar dehydrogenase [Ignavibacteria bacterium]
MIEKIFTILILTFVIASCNETKSTSFSLEEAFPYLTFSNPVDLQSPRDGTNRLFVVEQQGRIIVFVNDRNTTTKKVFLDISDRVSWGGEMGLLGLAFHPQFSSNGYFYVNYTANNPRRTVISRFRVSPTNPDSADKNSELILMTFNQPYSNHNGGCLAFGPDGYLYIATGDGGSAGDPQNNAQNLTNLLGKILRIDVNNQQAPLNYAIPADNPFANSPDPNIKKEIYAYGLRNPWRFSFDQVTNKLWCADVGQYDWEEIDIIENGGNYGWRCYEGNHPYNLSGCSGSYIFPIYEYSHIEGISITGGYVYRGNQFPELTGKYIYGDFGSKKIWALTYDGSSTPVNELIATCPQAISSFGIDDQNEIYVVGYEGRIYKLKKVTRVENQKNKSEFIKIYQPYPNPTNGKAKIKYEIQKSDLSSTYKIFFKIYNLLGENLLDIYNEHSEAGNYELNFETDRLTSGIYFTEILINQRREIFKLLIIK